MIDRVGIVAKVGYRRRHGFDAFGDETGQVASVFRERAFKFVSIGIEQHGPMMVGALADDFVGASRDLETIDGDIVAFVDVGGNVELLQRSRDQVCIGFAGKCGAWHEYGID